MKYLNVMYVISTFFIIKEKINMCYAYMNIFKIFSIIDCRYENE